MALGSGAYVSLAVSAHPAFATAALTADCVHLHVSATPKINAQNAPYETIRNSVTSCATRAETVTLTQHIVGPYAQTATAAANRTWTIALAPGQTVVKVQHIPYSCCGSFTVTDRAISRLGQILGHASTNFTFA
jgi:hypothetical protein